MTEQLSVHTQKAAFSNLPLLVDADPALLALVLHHKGMKMSNRYPVSRLGSGELVPSR